MAENDKKYRRSKSSIDRARKEQKRKSNNIILICIVALFVGHYILNYVSAIEHPPLGITFNIVLGCIIIAVSLLTIFFTVKKQYFSKKKKITRHVFLDEQLKKEKKSGSETR